MGAITISYRAHSRVHPRTLRSRWLGTELSGLRTRVGVGDAWSEPDGSRSVQVVAPPGQRPEWHGAQEPDDVAPAPKGGPATGILGHEDNRSAADNASEGLDDPSPLRRRVEHVGLH
jgi:hypothetical protein